MIGLDLRLVAWLAPKPEGDAREKSDVSIRVVEVHDDPERKHPISTLSRVRSGAAEAAFHAASDWISAPGISLASAVPIGSWKRRLDRVKTARGTHWLNRGIRFRWLKWQRTTVASTPAN
jgi:hypothetical protein